MVLPEATTRGSVKRRHGSRRETGTARRVTRGPGRPDRRQSTRTVGFEALLPATFALAGMDRDAAVEAAVAFVGVGTLAAIIIGVGMTHGNSQLSGDGGLMLVAAIGFFIVLMTAIGLGLSRRY
jgi:hypothetical protein